MTGLGGPVSAGPYHRRALAFASLTLLLLPLLLGAAQAPGVMWLAPDVRVGMPPITTTPGGFQFVDEGGAVVGRGVLRTYRVEVEPKSGVNTRGFTYLAEQILNDERGWTGAGDWALQRVTVRDADIRVVLATPPTVDRLCAQAGLDTNGEVSCWNGRFAAINVDRWIKGAEGFTGSLRAYRRYVLNHEVGHGLGYSHRPCPRPGARAPVMQQQTYATKPCIANGWPALTD
jgi:hypothetical protein